MNKPFNSLDSLYTNRWIQAELSYIRGIIHILLDQEAQASPLIAPALQGIKSSSGKMLRPLLCLLGARCAGGKEYDYDSLSSGPSVKELQKLEKTSQGWILDLKEPITTNKYSSSLESWKKSPPFTGGLPNSLYLVAAGIELLHLATLVHDDVIDESHTRRGQPAIWKQIGRRHAVLLGDLLMSLCFALVSHGAGVETGQILSGMVRVMARCEFLQAQERLEFRSSLAHPSRRRYNRVITGKTALLFSLSLSSGATEMTRYLQQSSSDQQVSANQAKLNQHVDLPFLQHLRRGGYCLGTGFQIQDDMLDLLGNTSFGKPLGQDLRDRQITLPLIEALLASSESSNGSDSDSDKHHIKECDDDSSHGFTQEDLRKTKQELIARIETFEQGDESVLPSITKLIAQLGGFAKSDQRSTGLLNQARKEFDLACNLQETPGTKELLDLLMVFLLDRKY
jgi:geranylgeranyl pyrophosphate synthase